MGQYFHAFRVAAPAWFRACLAGLLFFLAPAQAWAEEPVPPLAARVTDLTATLDAAGRQALEAKLAALEQARGVQLAVLLVASTQPESVEQYALRVVESWKLGRKGGDEGLLLLLAKEDRTLRIEVGYGLEGVIPDALAKRIIAEVMVPKLQAGDFSGAVNAGVDALIGLVQGEAPPPPPQPKARSAWVAALEAVLPLLMMFIAVAGGIARLLFGRLAGAVIAAAVAFIGAWILLGGVVIAVIVAVVTFIFTLMGVSVGNMGGGRGGGGGGGFSGGGGGFGGGGASGRW